MRQDVRLVLLVQIGDYVDLPSSYWSLRRSIALLGNEMDMKFFQPCETVILLENKHSANQGLTELAAILDQRIYRLS